MNLLDTFSFGLPIGRSRGHFVDAVHTIITTMKIVSNRLGCLSTANLQRNVWHDHLPRQATIAVVRSLGFTFFHAYQTLFAVLCQLWRQ